MQPHLTVPRFAPRDSSAPARGATPLELLFDLAAVVAIGAAAAHLADAVAAGEIRVGLSGFLCSFFMIWWAWMNHTWFASAYDDGSAAFRVLTMVMMFGALMLAAGIGAVFAQEPIRLALSGFVLMRLALVALWIGAARGDPERRPTTLRYAVGIVAAQLYWIALVAFVPPAAPAYLPLFIVGAGLELVVPALAERRGATAWHRGHIVARYGRLTLIVLGQCFIAIVAALETALGAAGTDLTALWQALLFVLIAFSLWSLYFTDDAHLGETGLGRALTWGYGHVAVFAGAAVVGGAMRVLVREQETASAATLLALAAAVYVMALWLVRDRFCMSGRALWLLPAGAAGLVAVALLPVAAPEPVAAILVLIAIARRRPAQGQKAA